MNDLTPAERATQVVIAGGAGCACEPGESCDPCSEDARAVVAAVRPIIEAEILEIHASIYAANPDRETAYSEVADDLGQCAARSRDEHDEQRLRAAGLEPPYGDSDCLNDDEQTEDER